MPKNEPQSYGSQNEWLTGKTGQNVNNPKSGQPAQHQDFYESRRDSETSAPTQGGELSDYQLAENAQPTGGATEATTPVSKVPDKETGAKRGSYFKERDYK